MGQRFWSDEFRTPLNFEYDVSRVHEADDWVHFNLPIDAALRTDDMMLRQIRP